MADESVENRDPGSERSGQAPRVGEDKQSDRSSSRRRIMVASLLAPPAVMTLSARSARAQTSAQASAHPSTDPQKKKKHY